MQQGSPYMARKTIASLEADLATFKERTARETNVLNQELRHTQTKWSDERDKRHQLENDVARLTRERDSAAGENSVLKGRISGLEYALEQFLAAHKDVVNYVTDRV